MGQNSPAELISIKTVNALLKSSTSEFDELKECYALLPATLCKRKAYCCTMLPETTLLEALAALKRLQQEAPEKRRRVLKKIAAYFFVNPAQITACPFLEKKQCLIYEDRFFGCRAYGLWSLPHYEKIANQSRRAKRSLAKLWQRLGIRLPEEVIDFHLPYCGNVKTMRGAATSDASLIHLSEQIDWLSGRMAPWHQNFRRVYYADLSFLVTAMAYDIEAALRLKVDIVRNLIYSGSRNLLDEALEKVSDVL